ncbi:limbic system-associated membrane protein-like [Polyodon spathula]|uniref:limbic system-associated membrane protein-like n=1 Tax=Polyodon spathula TaxID=7913 RepID=UPI001B7E2F69|nr:limbic system-associated membrane protein-like [Polyodon spathula]
MESKNAEIPVGRAAALQCNAVAVPRPDFEWYRDDKRIFSAEGIKIQNYGTHSVLMVSNVTEEHYGNYTCVATNKLGINNANLFLYSGFFQCHLRQREYSEDRFSQFEQ